MWQNRIVAHEDMPLGALTAHPENETWAAVAEFPSYEVSNLGRVRRFVTGRILAQTVMPAGYRACSLWERNIGHTRLVHRLVAVAFYPGNVENTEVNHRNLDKGDNRAENLEWVSRSENLLHRARHGIGRGSDNRRRWTRTSRACFHHWVSYGVSAAGP